MGFWRTCIVQNLTLADVKWDQDWNRVEIPLCRNDREGVPARVQVQMWLTKRLRMWM